MRTKSVIAVVWWFLQSVPAELLSWDGSEPSFILETFTSGSMCGVEFLIAQQQYLLTGQNSSCLVYDKITFFLFTAKQDVVSVSQKIKIGIQVLPQHWMLICTSRFNPKPNSHTFSLMMEHVL